MKDKGKVARYLERHYLAWCNEQGEVRPLQEFADFLEIKRETFNRYYNGSRKNIEIRLAKQIATKLKDFEILDILGYPRPGIEELLAGLSPEERDPYLLSLKEINDEVVKRGITTGSPEAVKIISDAFARHGVTTTIEFKN